MKEYSKVIFETEEKDYLTIWYSDINSKFLTENDHIVCFRDEEVLDAYCKAKGINTGRDVMLFDLTSLMEFAAGVKDEYNPSDVLNFWNICSDLAFTINQNFLGDDDNETLSELYDTLFFMESVDEEEADEFVPQTLTSDDIDDLREIIKEGCSLIIGNLMPA